MTLQISRQALEEWGRQCAEDGARRALAAIGLEDEGAVDDVKAIRNLLSAWRDAKTTAWKTFVKMVTTAVLTALTYGVYLKLKGGP